MSAKKSLCIADATSTTVRRLLTDKKITGPIVTAQEFLGDCDGKISGNSLQSSSCPDLIILLTPSIDSVSNRACNHRTTELQIRRHPLDQTAAREKCLFLLPASSSHSNVLTSSRMARRRDCMPQRRSSSSNAFSSQGRFSLCRGHGSAQPQYERVGSR
jgi:hypothetical protein